MSNEQNHIHNIRHLIMRALALYAATHDDVNDAQMVGALSACMCDALIIKGASFDDEVIDCIRKTYEVCAVQRAMTEKEESSVQ